MMMVVMMSVINVMCSNVPVFDSYEQLLQMMAGLYCVVACDDDYGVGDDDDALVCCH